MQFKHKIELTHEIEIKELNDSNRFYILLHGHQLNGTYMFERFKDLLNGTILAPNAPFLYPLKKNESFEARYTWYFFDPFKKDYYIGMEPAAEYVNSIIQTYVPKDIPVTVIGYSQGGYLAPKIAELNNSVDTVIGLACTFRSSRYQKRENVSYYQINSKSDPLIDYANAKEEYFKLHEDKSNFITLENTGHKLNSDYIDEVLKILGS